MVTGVDMDIVRNGFYVTLTSGIDSSQTSFDAELSYPLSLGADETILLAGGQEAMRVVSITGSTLTVVRGVEGTAHSHNSEDRLFNRLTQGMIDGTRGWTAPAGNVLQYDNNEFTALNLSVPTSSTDIVDFVVIGDRIFDAVSYEMVPYLKLKSTPWQVDVSPDGHKVAFGGGAGVEIIDMQLHRRTAHWPFLGDSRVFWLDNSTLIIVTTSGVGTYAYQADSPVVQAGPFTPLTKTYFHSAKMLPDRTKLVVSAASNTAPVEVFEVPSLTPVPNSLSVWGGSSTYIPTRQAQMDVSPDGSYIACVTANNSANCLKIVDTGTWTLIDEPTVGISGYGMVAIDPHNASEYVIGNYYVEFSSGYPYIFYVNDSMDTVLTRERSVMGLLYISSNSSNSSRIESLMYTPDGRYFTIKRRAAFQGRNYFVFNVSDWSINTLLTTLANEQDGVPMGFTAKCAKWRQGVKAASSAEAGPKGLQGIVASSTAPDESQIWVVDNNG